MSKIIKDIVNDKETHIHTHHHECNVFFTYWFVTMLMALPVYLNNEVREAYKLKKGEDYKEWKYEVSSVFNAMVTGWFMEPMMVGKLIYDKVNKDNNDENI